MYNIDEDVLNKLLSFCDLKGFAPGAFLYNSNDNSKNQQLKCIADIFDKIKPKYVLETGTESAMFCYFVKCLVPDIKVVTFGMNDGHNPTGDHRSQKCTTYLNQIFNNYIEYIEGDSALTLTAFNTKEQIDFAWIDGCHDYNFVMSDLTNCLRLGIKHICLDDYSMFSDVRSAVNEFVNTNSYRIQCVTDEERGICYITNE